MALNDEQRAVLRALPDWVWVLAADLHADSCACSIEGYPGPCWAETAALVWRYAGQEFHTDAETARGVRAALEATR